MKKLAVIGVAIVLMSGGGYFYWAHKKANDPKNQCWEYVKKDLRDPFSAILDEDRGYTKEGKLVIFYRAKNGFGAYTPGRYECLLDKAGRFDLVAMLDRELEELKRSSKKNK